MTPAKSTGLPDQILLERAIQGDAEAFGDLYERHLDEILRYVFYRVANRFEAEDLTETVFLKAWEALPRFASSKVNLRAWLYRIAHNVVIDHYRARKTTLDVSDVLLRDEHPLPEQRVQAREQNQQLALALQSLNANLQNVIICRFINGLSHSETAQIMGMHEGHVRVLQYRALKKLRQWLEKV
jgi:RNA polymerase sigma-70 factor, ECF subfamily